MEASLTYLWFSSVSGEAKTLRNESKEKSSPAQGQPVAPPKPEKQEPNVVECAVLHLPTSHQLGLQLPEVFLKLRENEIGRTGHTALPETGAVTATTAGSLT